MTSGNDPYYPYGSNFQTATDGWYVSQPGADTPDSYGPQPNADVKLSWAVISVIPIKEFAYTINGMQMADPEATYQTYQTISDSFFCDTTLTDYPSDVPNALIPVYAYFSSQVETAQKVEVHWTISITNVTAPPPPAGAWVQAKGHIDGHMTQDQINSVNDLYTVIESSLPFIQSVAKY